MKLNCGSGNTYFQGWVNIDFYIEKADLKLDLRQPVPFLNNSIELVYSEHFIEHLTLLEGQIYLKEMFRVLKKDGIIRVACPDLDLIVKRFVDDSWREDFKQAGIPCNTKCEMIDLSCLSRSGGHMYMYNFEELKLRLEEAGFIRIEKQEWGQSKHQELLNRESRVASDLIVEGIRP